MDRSSTSLPSTRSRAVRWLVGSLALALVCGAGWRLVTSAPDRPPRPLSSAQVTAFVYLRCEVLLQPFSLDAGGSQEPRPRGFSYATALLELAGELEPLDVDPAVRPTVDELGRALRARADSVEAELRAYDGGTTEQIAQAQAAGVAREGELDAVLGALDLPACASY